MTNQGKVNDTFMLKFKFEGNEKQWRCVVKNL